MELFRLCALFIGLCLLMAACFWPFFCGRRYAAALGLEVLAISSYGLLAKGWTVALAITVPAIIFFHRPLLSWARTAFQPIPADRPLTPVEEVMSRTAGQLDTTMF